MKIIKIKYCQGHQSIRGRKWHFYRINKHTKKRWFIGGERDRERLEGRETERDWRGERQREIGGERDRERLEGKETERDWRGKRQREIGGERDRERLEGKETERDWRGKRQREIGVCVGGDRERLVCGGETDLFVLIAYLLKPSLKEDSNSTI